jgi:NAD(P)H-nitrite reductase large subunit
MVNSKKEQDLEEVYCRCEEVTRKEIDEAIESGALTLDDVKRYTRAGMGLCQGKFCSRIISQYLAGKLERSLSEIPLCSSRVPVRPVNVDALAADLDGVDCFPKE